MLEGITVDMEEARVSAKAENEEVSQCLEHIRSVEIANDTELRSAVSIAAVIKEKHTAVNTERLSFIVGAQAIIDKANSFFQPALNSLAECEKVIKDKIVGFDSLQRDKRNTLILHAGDAGACDDPGKAEALLAHADECIVPKVPGLSLRRSMKIEVNDIKQAVMWCIANGRTDLLQVNDKAIKALVKKDPDGLQIPGVTVLSSTTAAITVSRVDHG